jgi:hypothetical protein
MKMAAAVLAFAFVFSGVSPARADPRSWEDPKVRAAYLGADAGVEK